MDGKIGDGGRYEAQLHKALEDGEIQECMLIVVTGKHGPGLSVHGSLTTMRFLPDLLRQAAVNIESSKRDKTTDEMN